MAIVKWANALDLITPHVPTCPIDTITDYLGITYADFCARTHIWRETIDPQYTVSNVAEYDVDGEAVIESVLWATCEKQNLIHTDARLVDPTTLDDTGMPTKFWVLNDTTIRLYKIPDRKYSLNITVALKPYRKNTGMQDWLYETYIDHIINGALCRILKIPNKEWSNFELALYHSKEYEQAVTNARIRDYRNVNLKVVQRRM